jgi:O-antigen/teichoic acid export membrane protein
VSVATRTSLGGRASRGALTALIGQWIKFLIQLATLVTLARLIEPEDFGRYAMVLAVAGLATLLSDFGLPLAAMRTVDLTEQEKSNLFWANLLLGLVCGGAVALLAGPIAEFYGDALLADLSRVMAFAFLAQAASAQLKAELVRRLRVAAANACDIGASALALVCAVAVAVAGGGVWALVASQVAFAGGQLALLTLTSRWVPHRPRRTRGMGRFFRFGAHTGGVQLVNYATANTDTVLLGRFWGPDVVGVYNQAYQLFRLPLQQLASPMTQVAVPILSRLDDPGRFRSYVVRAQLILSYLLCGAFLTAAALAIPLLDLVLGPGWPDAARLFAILSVGGVFQGLGYVYYWVFIAKDLTAVQLRYALISRGAMLVLLCAATPWGNVGMAVASSVGLALNWVILSVLALPHSGLRWRDLLRVSVRPLLVFLALFAVVYPVGVATRGDLAPVAQLTAMGVGSLLLVGAAMGTIRPLRRDLAVIVGTARQARNREGTHG